MDAIRALDAVIQIQEANEVVSHGRTKRRESGRYSICPPLNGADRCDTRVRPFQGGDPVGAHERNSNRRRSRSDNRRRLSTPGTRVVAKRPRCSAATRIRGASQPRRQQRFEPSIAHRRQTGPDQRKRRFGPVVFLVSCRIRVGLSEGLATRTAVAGCTQAAACRRDRRRSPWARSRSQVEQARAVASSSQRRIQDGAAGCVSMAGSPIAISG